ncbi:DUF805 domain-containing protein [Sphingomonas lacunae]|nr:DUF805 domain-containing protein [Sphingomonas lacunae]
MTESDWIDFSFRFQGEGHLICSSDDAWAHIASGALTPSTRVTAFLPSGRKVMDAGDLPHLRFASHKAATEPVDTAPTHGLVSDGEVEQAAAEPLLQSTQAAGPEAMETSEPAKPIGRKAPPVSTVFKKERVTAARAPAPAGPPPRWLADPVWIQPLHRYAEFDGRSTRLEYWSYSLALFIALLVILLFAEAVGDTLGAIVVTIVVLATIIPHVALTVRRLHDMNASGWLLVLMIVPLVIGGPVATLANIGLLVIMTLPGTAGPNSYGPPSLR